MKSTIISWLPDHAQYDGIRLSVKLALSEIFSNHAVLNASFQSHALDKTTCCGAVFVCVFLS